MSRNLFSKPLGKSMFVIWDQVDAVINNWAQAYFGTHVSGFGVREETDFLICLRGLKPSDYEKFAQLFHQHDQAHNYDPEAEFSLEGYDVEFPAAVARGILYEALPGQGLQSFGTILATYDGIFVMENDLQKQREQAPPVMSLDSQIDAASAQVVEPSDTNVINQEPVR